MNKILSSNRGFTLVEVLLTLVIATIFSGIIYSVFITGLKLYQKIQVEGQLRDDADYIATMILNEMYSNAPKYVESYSEGDKKGIKLVRANEKTVDGYVVEDDPNSIETEIKFYFENNNFFIQKNTDPPLQLNTEKTKLTTLNLESGIEEKSEITLDQIGDCNTDFSICSHGTIKLRLILTDQHSQEGSLMKLEPLKLESSFGF